MPTSDGETVAALKMRMDLAEKASESARRFFGACVIAALVLMSAVYNDSLSQTRDLGRALENKSKGTAWGSPRDLTSVLQEELLRQWVDSTYVNVPLTGVRISVNDADLLGSVTMAALSFCLFVALKRENRVVRQTLEATQALSVELQELIRETLLCTQVFSVAGTPALPKNSLRLGTRWQQPVVNFISSVVCFILVFFPFIAVCVSAGFDVASLRWMADLFRESQAPPNIPVDEILTRLVLPAVFFGTVTFAFGLGAWRVQNDTASLTLGSPLRKPSKLRRRGAGPSR